MGVFSLLIAAANAAATYVTQSRLTGFGYGNEDDSGRG